jgi:hypothetical protein
MTTPNQPRHAFRVGDIVWTMPDYPTRTADRFVVVKLLPTGYALQGGPGHVRVDFGGQSRVDRNIGIRRCAGWASLDVARASARELHRQEVAAHVVPFFVRGLWRGLTTDQLERVAAIVREVRA